MKTAKLFHISAVMRFDFFAYYSGHLCRLFPEIRKIAAKGTIHIGKLISRQLDDKHDTAWLAQKIGKKTKDLENWLEKESIEAKWLYKISVAMQIDFFACYSESLQELLAVKPSYILDKKIHIGELIRSKIDEDKRTVAWLARKIDIDKSKLRRTLEKETLDVELIFAVSAGMGFDFLGYYSEKFRIGSLKYQK